MKLFLITTFISLFSIPAMANIETEFRSHFNLVRNYLKADSSILPELDREELLEIQNNLNIYITEERPRDHRGVQKAAVFNRKGVKVFIHKETWLTSSKHEQMKLTAMELLGLAGITEKRYEIVYYHIFPFKEDHLRLERAQMQLCHNAGRNVVEIFGSYSLDVWQCRNQWIGLRGTNFIKRREALLVKAIESCERECSYDGSEHNLRDGWCSGIRGQIKWLKSENQEVNGNACIE